MRRRALARGALTLACLLSASATTAAESVTYTYDARGRLVQVGRSGAVNSVNSSFNYDRADNRTNVTVTGSSNPSFSVSGGSVTEGGILSFTVTKNGSATGTVAVNYATANDSALSGSDFTAAAGLLSFATNETTKVVQVQTIDDLAAETPERLHLNLSNASPGTVILGGQASGIVNDNGDTAATVSISDVSCPEGNQFRFRVTRTGSTDNTVSVDYATANGTASSGSDYMQRSGTINLFQGSTQATIDVFVYFDGVTEGPEAFVVNLTSSTAVINDGQGVGTIIDGMGGGQCE